MSPHVQGVGDLATKRHVEVVRFDSLDGGRRRTCGLERGRARRRSPHQPRQTRFGVVDVVLAGQYELLVIAGDDGFEDRCRALIAASA